MNYNLFLAVCVLTVMILSCHDKTNDAGFQSLDYAESSVQHDEQPLFTLLDSSRTGVAWINTFEETEQINILTYEYLYNGGGVAAGDINQDGLVDLYFTGNMTYNKLYLNEGNFRFRDITISAGVDGGLGFKTGVTMADVNNDGFLDIYICKSMLSDPDLRKNVLYINNGNLTFSEKAAEYGLDDNSFSTQAYFFDMDTDGDLDMYLVNHPINFLESNNIPLAYNAAGALEVTTSKNLIYVRDILFENKEGRFMDISSRAGITDEAFGLSAVIGDFNHDRQPDIYVCNDYFRPDLLYINNGNGTFTNRFSDFFRHSSFSSMGSDFADINNDGCFDLLTLDMLPRDHYRQNMLSMVQNFDKFQRMVDYGLEAQYSANMLQLSNCDGTYSDIALLADIAYTDWSWSGLFGDFDNDGWKDLFISNGYKRDVTNQDYARYLIDSLRKEVSAGTLQLMDWISAIPSEKTRSFLFKNNANLSFSDVSQIWNSGPPAFSNGVAYADLDNDGYLDLVVNNIDVPAFILKNEGKASRQNNYLRFDLKDEKGKTCFGTRIRIYMTDGRFQDQELYPTRGFLSSVEPIVHFGIGKATSVTSAEIIWPDGSTQSIENPAINTVHQVSKNASGKYAPPQPKRLFFTDISARLPKEAVHKENSFIDFKREPLLHHKYSEEGPATASGDVNGDGLDDVYLGGAAGFAGKLLLQQRNGSFNAAKTSVFEKDSLHEDVAALFVDANGDGALDLIVISGGNEQLLHTSVYQSRLYLNNGKGEFSKWEDGLPRQFSSGGCVAGADIDGDGDQDLFIGARVSPGKYPLPPVSNLLRNDNGKFTNVTAEWSDGLINIGMLTDARFADLDKDGTPELILAGEWMPITIFRKVNNKYINATSEFGISDISGWWYSLEIADLNSDGFPDIVAGNLGLNSHIQASKEKPATLHYKDFDGNGTIDPILCFFNGDTSYPLPFRDRLLDQMIILKKKFTRYHMYADATLEDILTPEQLKDAKVLTANTFSHTLFLNQGGKSFAAQQLPKYTQISTVRSIKAMDVNNDGKTDLVLGGNFYSTDAQLGRYDASVGAILIGDGQGHFQVVGSADSGFCIPGNVRSILPLKSSTGTNLFVARNSDKSSLFELKK